jgi:hypothetical protein
LFKKCLVPALAIVATLSVAACGEKLESGVSCPLLCPQQAVTLRDTTIDALVVDTTVSGLPPLGAETYLMLASYGDSLDARAIIRYDTLPTNYTKEGFDSTIVNIDTAQLVAPVLLPDSAHRPTMPFTIEAYDVDTTASDTVAAVLATLFRPSRLLGSKTISPDSLTDTLRIPISADTVLERAMNGKRLRIGLRIVSAQNINLRLATARAGVPVRLRIRASLDTTATPLLVSPLSLTPVDQPFLQAPLADFTIIVKGVTTTPVTMLGVGGVPSRRVFLRFSIPSHIIDSTSIVRASLLLTQSPNRRLNLTDSVYVFPVPILASPAVTDYQSALQFLGGAGQFGLDSLLLTPADSGLRSFEIVGLVRTWRQQPLTVSPRTLALVSGAEGQLPDEFDFFSTKAPVAVRPRLRITYVPPTSSGLP